MVSDDQYPYLGTVYADRTLGNSGNYIGLHTFFTFTTSK